MVSSGYIAHGIGTGVPEVMPSWSSEILPTCLCPCDVMYLALVKTSVHVSSLQKVVAELSVRAGRFYDVGLVSRVLHIERAK